MTRIILGRGLRQPEQVPFSVPDPPLDDNLAIVLKPLYFLNICCDCRSEISMNSRALILTTGNQEILIALSQSSRRSADFTTEPSQARFF